jgi:hypothetical protein
MNDTMAPGCPSHFALDDLEAQGRGSPAAGNHPADCVRCAARQAERATQRAIFDAQQAALWTRIAAAGHERWRRRPGRWRLGLAALAMGLGAVALRVTVRRSESRADSYLAPKGRTPIEIVCRRGGAVFVLGPGDDVAPGDELRFRPLPVWPEARFLQIGSVDGTGRYTPFYPDAAGAPSVALPGGTAALDGSIRLDDAPGPERVFIVTSRAPVSETEVARLAEAGAAAGATVDRIQGEPVQSAWIVLPKRAGGIAAP